MRIRDSPRRLLIAIRAALAPQDELWTTSEGQRVWIRDLEVGHLVNVYKLTLRRVKAQIRTTQRFYMTCLEPQGEMALDHFLDEFDFWLSEQADPHEFGLDSWPFYRKLWAEVQRRPGALSILNPPIYEIDFENKEMRHGSN